MAGALADLAKPSGGDFVCAALQPLVLVYGLGEQAKSPAFWAVYVKALQDLPREAITDAVDDYSARPDSLYFPKPGQLRDIAMRRGERLLRMASRAREAANMELRRAPEKTDADKAAVKEMLAGYLGTFKAKTVPTEAMRANHGPTDSHGITPAMRARIEQQGRA